MTMVCIAHLSTATRGCTVKDKELIEALASCLDDMLLAALAQRGVSGILADRALELIEEAKQ